MKKVLSIIFLFFLSGISHAEKVKAYSCEQMKFFKSLGTPEKVFFNNDPKGDPSDTLAKRKVIEIFKSSQAGKLKLPRWLNPNGWISPSINGFGIADGCALWKGDEWYLRSVFIPQDAPDGHGYIATNLSRRTVSLQIYQTIVENGKEEEKLIFEGGDKRLNNELDESLGNGD